MTYSIHHIAEIIGSSLPGINDDEIAYLLIDSRKIIFPKLSLFFALSGPRRDGHQFIQEVYDRGIRNFVVKDGMDNFAFSDANILQVSDVLTALQQLVAFHRKKFNIPVIGITGSNGKTVVKEWLYQLLHTDFQIVRSPRSFNSQVGVPLSVWQINQTHTLGIFEAGISTVDEMEKLASIIQPTIGILTNIADAHAEGFENNRQKALEKSILFKQATKLVFSKDATFLSLSPDGADKNLFPLCDDFISWSRRNEADLVILSEYKLEKSTKISAKYKNDIISVIIPFTDRISIDNAITCWAVLLLMNYTEKIIQERMLQLASVDMRMQLKKGINHCYLLNDTYSNDISSLNLALDYLQQQAGNHRTTLILSDILQSGQLEDALYSEIAEQLFIRGIQRLIGIGPSFVKFQSVFTKANSLSQSPKIITSFYDSTEEFLHQMSTQQFKDEYILLKGARVFAFERISNRLEQKVHQTVMEINLSAMIHNLKEYQKQLKPSTKLMAMVKAFSYGSGSTEIASVLQFHKVDYLAVAYADEGVELRKAGIRLPIMVMNVDEAGFDSLVTYHLEPEIYSFPIYHSFHKYLQQQAIQQFPVHIKFNTGMNRLGFEVSDVEELAKCLLLHQSMTVKTVFSHLVASENAEHNLFTEHQVHLFTDTCHALEKSLGYTFLKHIANSAAIIRNPEYQFDMVRLGIGLYGVEGAGANTILLETVATLSTTIAQIRKVNAGETVGYNRKGKVVRDSLIATVRIGYADGLSRRLGNGVGKMYVSGRLVPVIGNVCMDMTMIDITDIPELKEGETVEIFGKHIKVNQLAEWADTIPYEIMTGISQRVKRIYMEE